MYVTIMTIGNQNAEQVPDMREYSESMRSHAGIVIICKDITCTYTYMCIGADECDPDFCNIFDDLLHAVHGNWP